MILTRLQQFQPKEAISEQSSNEEDETDSIAEESTSFMFGANPSYNTIQHLHPSQDHILILWHIFLDNVDPMTKILHKPTFQETLIQASSDINNVSKGLEVLIFAIYTAAVTSMDSDNCNVKFGEDRKTLLARYRHATERALSRANFMATSDIQVLQAFTLYLLVTRSDYDSRTTWAMAGVASRIAQGMGLHRDGTTFGISPFDTEIRRRLWWQISILDFRSAELSGTGRFREFTLSDTRPPSNVDDADIRPGMDEPPYPQEKATEMMACLLRCEINGFWKEKVVEKANASFENMRILLPHATTLEERDARLNELEKRLEEKYLRYCDPTVPVQFMSIVIARSAIDGMRLMAHSENKYARPENMSASQREYLWNLSIKVIKSDNLAHSTKALQRFTWHTDVYFQWHALIYLLCELRIQTLGETVDTAWELLNELFSHHPSFVTDGRKPLHCAVASLCVKAYNVREAALREKCEGVLPQNTPGYIQFWREQRKKIESMTIQSASTSQRDVAETLETEKSVQSTERKNSGSLKQQQPILKTPSIQGTQNQLLLSPLSAVDQQITTPDQFMFASDSDLAQGLAMAGIPADWMQWDDIMQEFDDSR